MVSVADDGQLARAEERLQETFRKWDRDQSGVVPLDYMEAILSRATPGLPPRQLRQVLRAFREEACKEQSTGDEAADVQYAKLIDWLFKPSARNPPKGQITTGNCLNLFALLPGLGEGEMPGFPVEACPAALPDLTAHQNLTAVILRNDASLYNALKDRRTKGGSSFARCIKPGIDDPSGKSIGAVAADEDSYKTFEEFFNPLVQLCHCGYPPWAKQPMDVSLANLSNVVIDPAGQYVKAVSVSARRNLKGFKFSPACSTSDRCDVERILVTALERTIGTSVSSKYYPLAGSSTYPGRPSGMTQEEEKTIAELGCLFREPTSKAHLASGIGRHWPQARGVFLSEGSSRFTGWVNEEDHLNLSLSQDNGDVSGAFSTLSSTLQALDRALQSDATGFARTDHFGYLTVCPSSIGTALCVSVSIRLPYVSSRQEFHSLCYSLGVRASFLGDVLYEITNREVLGVSELDIVNCVMSGCAQLVEVDKFLGERAPSGTKRQQQQQQIPIAQFSSSVYKLLPGLGEDDYPGFPTRSFPQLMPSISYHSSLATEIMKNDVTLYGIMRDRRTKLGVNFAQCIKPGMDSPSSKEIGAVACDEDCYHTFKELFDPILQTLHGTREPLMSQTASHHTSFPVIAASLEKYAVSCKVICRRNVRGFKFPPACDRGERQQLERLLATSLLMLGGDELHGDYFPLHRSATYRRKPDGMTSEKAEELDNVGLLFYEPTSVTELASGVGRQWPEARGVYAAESGRFAAWLNEEDHLCLTSLQTGGDLKQAFSRMVDALARIERGLQILGKSFVRTEDLGFLTTSPCNVGIGFSMMVSLRLPHLSGCSGFMQACQQMNLKAQHAQSGVWELRNAKTFSSSEACLLASFVDGCRRLTDVEAKLETGELKPSDVTLASVISGVD